MSSGSGEILKSSVRHGCSPNARQMRCTLVGEIPTRRANSRLDQCVAPSGTSSRVRITTSSTWASVIVRGTPGRGSSLSPSSRRARNRARHLTTVPRLTPSRAATATLLPPCAQASTIRARKATPCAVRRRLAQFSNVCRSSSDNTSGANLGSGISPAHARRRSCHHRPSDLKRNTTQVVMGELKTGTLGADRRSRGCTRLRPRRSGRRPHGARPGPAAGSRRPEASGPAGIRSGRDCTARGPGQPDGRPDETGPGPAADKLRPAGSGPGGSELGQGWSATWPPPRCRRSAGRRGWRAHGWRRPRGSGRRSRGSGTNRGQA